MDSRFNRNRSKIVKELENLDTVIRVMKNDGDPVDDEIRGFEKLRAQKIAELEAFDSFQQNKPRSNISYSPTPNGEQGKTEAVLTLIKRQPIGTEFKASELKQRLSSPINTETLRGILHRLTKDGRLKYVRKGVGRTPSVWRRIL